MDNRLYILLEEVNVKRWIGVIDDARPYNSLLIAVYEGANPTTATTHFLPPSSPPIRVVEWSCSEADYCKPGSS